MVHLMLQIRIQSNSFNENLMNTFYFLIIVAGYQDMTVGKTDMVTLFLEFII